MCLVDSLALSLEITENVNTDTVLSCRLQQGMYSEETTQLMPRSYVQILESMCDSPRGPIDKAFIWSSQDTTKALSIGQPPNLDATWSSTVSHRVDDNINAFPSRTALKDSDGNTMTYAQMGARVDSITEALRNAGSQQGDVIGVFQEPSPDWVCSLLAIFKAGAIYVPIDLRNSIPRLASIVRASRPSFIITDKTTTDKV